MIGAALNSDDTNVAKNDVGPDLLVNADLGLGPATRVRAEFGRVRYTYDRDGARPDPMPAEQVTLTRYTIGLLRKLDMAGASTFLVLGGGLYRYAAELTPLPSPTRPGVHLTYGVEMDRKGLGLRFELSARGIGGPQPRPVDGNPVPLPGRRFTDLLVVLGAGVGISWNF